jgi:hypothetical protein
MIVFSAKMAQKEGVFRTCSVMLSQISPARHSFLSAFPMFVPSLPWQNDHF